MGPTSLRWLVQPTRRSLAPTQRTPPHLIARQVLPPLLHRLRVKGAVGIAQHSVLLHHTVQQQLQGNLLGGWAAQSGRAAAKRGRAQGKNALVQQRHRARYSASILRGTTTAITSATQVRPEAARALGPAAAAAAHLGGQHQRDEPLAAAVGVGGARGGTGVVPPWLHIHRYLCQLVN